MFKPCREERFQREEEESSEKTILRVYIHDRYTSCTKFEVAVPAGIWTKEHNIIIILFKG